MEISLTFSHFSIEKIKSFLNRYMFKLEIFVQILLYRLIFFEIIDKRPAKIKNLQPKFVNGYQH
jgi:hypothetical protein